MCMLNSQLVSRALDMLTKMYSCRRANESYTKTDVFWMLDIVNGTYLKIERTFAH